MNRSDGFANDLLPNWKTLDQLIQCEAFKVQIGQGAPLFKFHGIDLNLANKTSIADLLDIASLVDGFVGWCSFMLPLAESLGKPFFTLWSARGMRSREPFIRSLTPKKVIHRKDLSYHAVDDEPFNRIHQKFADFLREVTRRASPQGQADRAGRLRAGGTG
jgi:ADP-heptose:LPS heptosyltransferase